MTFFLSAYIIRIFERPYYIVVTNVLGNPFDSYLVACWLVVNTMTLMGLSPVPAVTPLGKLCATFICLSGTLLISLLIAIISDFIILSAQEERALARIKNERNAMQAIVTSLKFR